MDSSKKNQPELENSQIKPSRLIYSRPSATTLISLAVIAFLLFAFISGITKQFYASALFLFYALIGQMWIAVVCIGVFQVLLMIPFRIINLKKSAHINEFKEKTQEMRNESEQAYFVKENIRKGNRLILYYTVEFFVQLTSYLSIGRLFLTDFYSTPLESRWLYSFIPYPKYPIQGTYFKIPYFKFSQTVDLGAKTLLIVWFVLIAVQIAIHFARSFYRRYRKTLDKEFVRLKPSRKILKYTSGYLVISLIISWILVRHFPNKVQFSVFSGDISIPNRTFNTITAIVTFGTILWFGANKIERKSKMARNHGVDELVVAQTQKDMFNDNFKSAAFVGLGAFFITNQIPSAFELSIFTFELIALASPFTLDKVILRNELIRKIDSNQNFPDSSAENPETQVEK